MEGVGATDIALSVDLVLRDALSCGMQLGLVLLLMLALPDATLAETIGLNGEFMMPSSRYISGDENSENIPKDLSASEGGELGLGEQRLSRKLEGKENSGVRACASKCVATCTRGGSGSPGLGPAAVRKEVIVFKEGFRSRAYCLSECTNVCTSLKELSSKK